MHIKCKNISPCKNYLPMVKKYLKDVILFVHKNTHEAFKHWIQADFDG